ncbi:serine hydrolase [Mesorhizobium sp.]|uniref:serine hydrolase domain-containing protein n=1 Tax=Mesorhizobium sp. TaxID=1871066 RepID=UPI0012209A79|nr:serine hydrolase [Mesorhizobium sp.]TIN74281.1 MAG: serine hydrolase [Mesorhizobium sp.]TIO63824.1 MAG: serine hydrolase [Mesorhizobium sp.]TJV85622.1 MAG: serine hydrolase [Mesorhizobium sp.]
MDGRNQHTPRSPAGKIPDWVVYPEHDWLRISPRQAGLDEQRFATFTSQLNVGPANFAGEDHSNGQWGAVLTRGGYLIHEWGNGDYAYQTASTAKAFTWALLGFAIEDKLLYPDEPINRSWTGAGQLSHPHKYLDSGHHKTLTWRHLVGDQFGFNQYGGFPIEFGNRWRLRQSGIEDDLVEGVPEWANWTGDPFYDLYSHAKPGTVGMYSSAGYWRLAQALTAVFKRDLKQVLDERLFSKLGIPASRWDWATGKEISKQKYLYPKMPDSYTYLDPPYEIEGIEVRGGPGWIRISALDLARFGHLIATGGIWKGQRILDENWLRGHGGGNKSGVWGESEFYTAMAKVTTAGLEAIKLDESGTRLNFVPRDCFLSPPLGGHSGVARD